MNISTIQSTDTEAAARVSSPSPVRVVDTGAAAPKVNVSVLKPSDAAAEEARNEEKNLDKAETQEIVEALNDYMDDLQTNLRFAIRDDLEHQVVVEIKNRKTDELVKQIPSEELLKIMENMKELNGIIFDQSV